MFVKGSDASGSAGSSSTPTVRPNSSVPDGHPYSWYTYTHLSLYQIWYHEKGMYHLASDFNVELIIEVICNVPSNSRYLIHLIHCQSNNTKCNHL